MPGIEIKRLRQEGKLDEALKMAKEEYEIASTDEWAKRNLSWVYDSYCKKYAEEGNYQAFDEIVCALIDLGVNESEAMLINSIGWRFRRMISCVDKIEDENERRHVLDRSFELVRQFNFAKPSETYSVLFKAFQKYKDVWPAFKRYCEWWNFDNFRQEDYVCEVLPAGKKEAFSLVERAYMAYSKSLLKEDPKDIEAIKAFVPKLETLSENHPEMDYPGYFAGKLMLALNEKGEDIVATIRPFLRKKKNEFWAWQLLAEAVEEEDKDLYLACLLRAVQCKTKGDFLVNIRLRLVRELAQRQAYYHAAQQFIKYCKTKLANNSNWRPSGETLFYYEQKWYKERETYKQEPVPIDYMALTDNVLFGDMPEQKCVVSFVNSDKQMVNVVYGKEKEGFFKYESSLKPSIGMVLSIRIQDISQDGYMKVLSAKRLTEEKHLDLDFFKATRGLVIFNKYKNTYSFKVDDIICYIPPLLADKHSLEKGQTIDAAILYSYNKKKSQWMWKIVDIEFQGNAI